jgi:hypothetical protein
MGHYLKTKHFILTNVNRTFARRRLVKRHANLICNAESVCTEICLNACRDSKLTIYRVYTHSRERGRPLQNVVDEIPTGQPGPQEYELNCCFQCCWLHHRLIQAAAAECRTQHILLRQLIRRPRNDTVIVMHSVVPPVATTVGPEAAEARSSGACNLISRCRRVPIGRCRSCIVPVRSLAPICDDPGQFSSRCRPFRALTS